MKLLHRSNEFSWSSRMLYLRSFNSSDPNLLLKEAFHGYLDQIDDHHDSHRFRIFGRAHPRHDLALADIAKSR